MVETWFTKVTNTLNMFGKRFCLKYLQNVTKYKCARQNKVKPKLGIE